jgi:molecular chaperone GrpE (heat shock protein)
MSDSKATSVPKWPFFLGDVLLLGTAYFVYAQAGGRLPLTTGELVVAAACVVAGGFLAVLPFILEQRAWLHLQTAESFESSAAQLAKLETLTALVGQATAQWNTVQESAGKTSAAAKSIADRMAAEVAAFTEFMQKANDSERANLKLEVEKLRRVEGEWVQGTVRLMDHVYALSAAAQRSGQRNVADQVSNFEKACRDTTRRLGLIPFVAKPGEAFDPARHQGLEEGTTPGAEIEDTVATGFTFQGRLIRQALVTVRKPAAESPAPPVAEPQAQLSLDPPASPS